MLIKPIVLISDCVVVCGISIALAVSDVALSQATHCKSRFLTSKEDPLRYVDRGDRCEGRYVREVAGEELSIASITQCFENYDLNSQVTLTIEWIHPSLTDSIQLEAFSLNPELAYRMDTSFPATNRVWIWKTDILTKLRISKRYLGILASANYHTMGETKRVYLPLRVQQKVTPCSSDGYTITVRPGVELNRCAFRLTLLDKKGDEVEVVENNKSLGYTSYPAKIGRGFKIPILVKSGIYKLEIMADTRFNGPTALKTYFYHSAW